MIHGEALSKKGASPFPLLVQKKFKKFIFAIAFLIPIIYIEEEPKKTGLLKWNL